MIDERQEELASLHVLDLLEGAERTRFEQEFAGNPELRALVDSLRRAAAELAHLAPAVQPPAALKARVLATIDAFEAREPAPANVIRPRFGFWQFAPWAAAAGFAIGLAWVGQRNATSRTEADALRAGQTLAELASKSLQQQLEAERILAQRQLQDAQQRIASAETQLDGTRTQLAERDRLLAEARTQTADRDRLLAEARTQLSGREREIAALTGRIDVFAGVAEEVSRKLGDAQQQIARLASELQLQGDLATFKITALASMLKNSPQALAVAVWDPRKQEGVLKVEKLPALLPTQDYQLWVVDPQYPNPVDGGVFTVDPKTGEARMQFKAKQPVGAVNAFAVTLERKGGVPKAEGPFVLLGK